MNILLIKHFSVGFMVSEIPRVSIFGYFPLSLTYFIGSCESELSGYEFSELFNYK